jgi:hypothetical protein
MVRISSAGVCIGIALIFVGCGRTEIRTVPIPQPVEVTVFCHAEFPDWVFAPVNPPWMEEVRAFGGDNRAMVQTLNLSRFLLESVNERLIRIQEIHNAAIERCREDQQ